MIATAHVIVITDTAGHRCYAVCEEMHVTIQLHGRSSAGRQSFESDAYHAEKWANENGFKYTLHIVKLDVDRHEVEDWNQQGHVEGT